MIRWSTNAGHLLERPDLCPRESQAPPWLEALLPKDDKGHTARVCPGLQDFFGWGYVVPLWCDVEIVRTEAHPEHPGDGVAARVPAGYGVAFHPAGQSLGSPWLHGMNGTPKPLSPWYLETPPGVSVLVLPVTGRCRRLLFEPIPGVIDTDVWHQTHAPCRWTRPPGDGEIIRAGTPFMHVLPFRRETWKHKLRFIDSEEELRRLHGPDRTELGHYRQLDREG